MTRTTAEAPFFTLWRNPELLDALARPAYLTTARYEPILRRQFGGGHIDLLFECADRSCVVSGIRLDAVHLITREQAALIWPRRIAALLGADRLADLERAVLPWLRALARARPMATEAIRRFAPSARFERARAAGLPGAAPLAAAVVRMAPYVYARRFASGALVRAAGAGGPLAQAVLADVAAHVDSPADDDDARFARAWFGVAPSTSAPGMPAVAIGDGATGAAPLTLELDPAGDMSGAAVEIPAPVPWDLLFAFDGADAPSAGRFFVHAPEPALRAAPEVMTPPAFGGSSGTIVLAVSSQAMAMRGADIDEAQTFGRRLAAEGFRVHLAAETSDPMLAQAQLLHIFGSPAEPHTTAFAEDAAARGIAFVFDVPPRAADPSGLAEHALSLMCRAALDDADIARYLAAYEQRQLDPVGIPEPSANEIARCERRFAELAQHAAAVLTLEEEADGTRMQVGAPLAGRVVTRGVFAAPEPAPEPIGHLVPSGPFALVHAAIGTRSHALFAALAAERAGAALVIAGPVYDVDYLQTLRGSAPNAVILADASEGVIAALYRRAELWIDAAPRPRSAAALLRALACGALPVVPAESAFARILGSGARTFAPLSVDAAADAVNAALALPDRPALVAALAERVCGARDPARAFAAVMTAYARVAAPA